MTSRNASNNLLRCLAGGAILFLAGCPSADDSNARPLVAGFQQEVQGVHYAPDCRVPENADELVAKMQEQVNRERDKVGLGPLTINVLLKDIAGDYACDMIERGFFDHVNPDGEPPIQRAIRANYLFLSIGENLAGGQMSVSQAMEEWMASPGHRDNILNVQWSEMGIAVRTGGEHGVYWVQEFGNPP